MTRNASAVPSSLLPAARPVVQGVGESFLGRGGGEPAYARNRLQANRERCSRRRPKEYSAAGRRIGARVSVRVGAMPLWLKRCNSARSKSLQFSRCSFVRMRTATEWRAHIRVSAAITVAIYQAWLTILDTQEHARSEKG